MLPAAHLCHATAARARFKIADKRGQAGYFSRVEEQLTRLPGVERVAANSHTGSVVVHHTRSIAELSAFAEREQLFRLTGAGYERAPLPHALAERVRHLDRTVAGLTGGEIDLRAVSAMALLGLAMAQLLRGNIAAPAITLLWYSLTLLLIPSERSESGTSTE